MNGEEAGIGLKSMREEKNDKFKVNLNPFWGSMAQRSHDSRLILGTSGSISIQNRSNTNIHARIHAKKVRVRKEEGFGEDWEWHM